MDLTWHKRPSLSIREVQRITGDSLASIEQKLEEGRLRGPEPGLVWPGTVQEVYQEPSRSAPVAHLPGRLERRARSLARKIEEPS